MNAINNLKTGMSVGIQEIKSLYQHRPPLYDIAIGVFRTAACSLILKGVGDVAIHLHKFEIWKPIVPPTIGGPIIITLFSAFFAYGEISSLVHWSKINKMCKNQSKKDVALICKAKSDWSGAVNKISSNELKIFQKLAQTHSIVLKKVDTVSDINDAIEQIHRQDRTIKTLFLTAHGQPNKIRLGKDEIIGHDYINALYNKKRQRISANNIHFDKLDPRADIVLASCSVGDNSNAVDGISIGEWFQLYAGPDRRVFAPNAPSSSFGINHTTDSNGEVNYSFSAIFGDDITSNISYQKGIEKLLSLRSKFLGTSP